MQVHERQRSHALGDARGRIRADPWVRRPDFELGHRQHRSLFSRQQAHPVFGNDPQGCNAVVVGEVVACRHCVKGVYIEGPGRFGLP